MARGELGWANAVAAGAPLLPGWLISSVSLALLLFLASGQAHQYSVLRRPPPS